MLKLRQHIYRTIFKLEILQPEKKISLISTPVHRALIICSDCKLHAELKNFFFNSTYEWLPDYVIENTKAHKLKTFTSTASHTVNKCPVYLDMPWLETPSVGLKNKIKANVKKCFFKVEQRVIFTSRPLLSAI